MKLVLTSMAAVVAVAAPVLAQAPYPSYPAQGYPPPAQGYPPQVATAYGDPYGWRAISPTPRDAYRDGYINRWQLEQLEGPLPQALQGPSPDGNRGGDGGGGGFNN